MRGGLESLRTSFQKLSVLGGGGWNDNFLIVALNLFFYDSFFYPSEFLKSLRKRG